jgi:hypothetical protein
MDPQTDGNSFIQVNLLIQVSKYDFIIWTEILMASHSVDSYSEGLLNEGKLIN